MALNPSGAISLAGPSAGQSIAVELGQSATATISLNDVNVRTLAQVPSGVIVMPTDFYGKSPFVYIPTQRGIIYAGENPGDSNTYNLVSNTGVVAAAATGTYRSFGYGSTYGVDKGILAYGALPFPLSTSNAYNTVSNTGVVSGQLNGVGVGRQRPGAAMYGTDKVIYAFGTSGTALSSVSYVSNTGTFSADQPSAGSAKAQAGGCMYGGNKGIILGGSPSSFLLNISNLVSDTGVLSSDTPTVSTRSAITGSISSYGLDKGICINGGNGYNLISNTGVLGSDTPLPGGVTVRSNLAGCQYGGDKAISAFGNVGSPTPPANRPQSITNLVSNTGVIAANTPNATQGKRDICAAGFGT
jgi:hypothetical protein